MHNAFTKYEEDYQRWKDDGYPNVADGTRDFLEHMFHSTKRLPMWDAQKEGVLRTVYAYEVLKMDNLLLNIVTGGGKTAIIGTIIFWLKSVFGINKFLILVPNTIVRARLESDFVEKKERVFEKFEMNTEENGYLLSELGLHIMEPGKPPQGMIDSGIILGNIQQLYTSHSGGQRNLGYLKNHIGDIAIFNDEAHNTPADEYTDILNKLRTQQVLRVDTTATPDRADGQEPDSNMIYHYGVAKAIDDNIIKRIVVYKPSVEATKLTYTNPDTGETRDITELDPEFEAALKGIKPLQWILDRDPMRKQIKLAIDRHEEQKLKARGRYRPILFVVTMSIREGERTRDMLFNIFNIKTLLVTEESDDRDREEAMKIGTFDSEYDAIVSVMMLREGWDVPTVSTILLLRKFSSSVYGQQVVGRGLRKIIRNDRSEIENLKIIDHPMLKHDWLWGELRVSNIRRDVEDSEDFTEDDNMTKENKSQYLKTPELLIDIPGPDYGDIKLPEIEADHTEDEWRSKLESTTYNTDWTLARVEIREQMRTDLMKNLSEVYPGLENFDYSANAELPIEEWEKHCARVYLEKCREHVVRLGYADEAKIKLYNRVIEHVKDKIFFGKEISNTSIDLLEKALVFSDEIMETFTDEMTRSILESEN